MSTDELREICERVTKKLLGQVLPEVNFLKANGIGVTIFAFTFEPGGFAYISSSEREGMIRALKEFIAYQEAGLTTEPRGERGAG